MFSKYKAAQLENFEKHLNKYHVIQMDVNTFRHRRDKETGETVTAMQTVGLIHTEVIKELREQFGESVEENDNDLPSVLSKINEDTGEIVQIFGVRGIGKTDLESITFEEGIEEIGENTATLNIFGDE